MKRMAGLLVTLIVVFSCPSFGATPEDVNPPSVLSSEAQIAEDFTTVPCRQKDRLPAVRALFEKMGAPADAIAIEKRNGVENLVVRITGTSDEKIVMGAHYDHVDRG